MLTQVMHTHTESHSHSASYSQSHTISTITCTASHNLHNQILHNQNCGSCTHSCTSHTQSHTYKTHIDTTTHRSKSMDLGHRFLSHRGDTPAVFDWFFEAACPASLQEGELGALGEGEDGGWAWDPEFRGLLFLQIPPSCGSSPQTSGTRYAGCLLAPLGQGQSPWGRGLCLGPGAQGWGPT